MIAICGRGESGKQIVSRSLRDHAGLRYTASTSEHAVRFVRPALAERGIIYDTDLACWLDRRYHRETWRAEIEHYNLGDAARMYREMAADQDVLDGLRMPEDLAACRAEGIVSLAVWVERPGTVDASCRIREEDCDVTIRNDGGIVEFVEKAARFASILRLPPKEKPQTELNPLRFDGTFDDYGYYAASTPRQRAD